MTAHDVVSCVRKILGIKQIGHGGTLDPMAQGVLPIAVGKACRLLRYLGGNKSYEAKILLGTTTTTDDLEGDVISTQHNMPAVESIEQAVSQFVGEIDQTPPLYSAIHHQGKRLYQLARQGVKVEKIASRKVNVYEFRLLAIDLPTVKLAVECSSGTYIRSLARDLGQLLSCGACLQSLTRTRSGPFILSESITLAQLSKLKEEGKLAEAIISPTTVLGAPVIELDAELACRLTMGQVIAIEPNWPCPNIVQTGHALSWDQIDGHVLLVNEGELIAVLSKTDDNKLKPEVVVIHAD